MSEDSLSTTFLTHLEGGPAGRPLPEALDARLEHLVEVGSLAWPDLRVDAPLFVRHLARGLTAKDDLGRALTDVNAADLYLACACTLGVKGAIERFESAHFAAIGAFLQKLDGSAAFTDEVRQILRQKLFVSEGDGAPPRIAGYAGRGRLAAWVGIAAQRVGLSLLRSERKHARVEDALAGSIPPGADPEIDYLRIRYRADFREAFRTAVGTLTDQERIILRLHVVRGLSHDKIAALRGVDQATISRRIARARESIARETQRYLNARSKLTTSEFRSLAYLVGSDLNLSLARWLGEDQD